MAPQMAYVSKTQHYLKVKKPLLERQRRARMNKYLDELKELVAEYQGNDAILRMDKAEMLECALSFIKKEVQKPPLSTVIPMDSFRHGFMNAVNEVSRVMAATPGMDVQVGKAVMIHLGGEYNRLLRLQQEQQQNEQQQQIFCTAPMSPASSGYHSDECDEDNTNISSPAPVWRPW